MTEQQNALARLLEAQINYMQFIMDYLVIGFSQKGALTLLVWPEIKTDAQLIKWGDLSYRDALCALIGKNVIKVTIDSENVISINLDSNEEVYIPLNALKLSGEKAILSGPQNYLFVF